MSGTECEFNRKTERSALGGAKRVLAFGADLSVSQSPRGRMSNVRLSRQPLRGMLFWNSSTRGEGRDLQQPPVDLMMHSDAADVGYGGLLRTCSDAGSPSL
jgi:hypothetical protein